MNGLDSSHSKKKKKKNLPVEGVNKDSSEQPWLTIFISVSHITK